MSEKAECPRCGGYTSRVYYHARCSCGWDHAKEIELRERVMALFGNPSSDSFWGLRTVTRHRD